MTSLTANSVLSMEIDIYGAAFQCCMACLKFVTVQSVAARDGITVADLGSLHQDTDSRQQVVDRVTTQLESELNVFAEFLDKVARHRPLRECICYVH